LIVAAAAVLVGVLAFVVPRLEVAHWIGHCDLSVSLESDAPITRVLYDTYVEEDAQWILQDRQKSLNASFLDAKRVGDAFVAVVTCYGSFDLYERESSYAEPRFIVFRCMHPDGTETWKMAEIPEGRGARSVTISIP
jgi:hypothetical protein